MDKFKHVEVHKHLMSIETQSYRHASKGPHPINLLVLVPYGSKVHVVGFKRSGLKKNPQVQVEEGREEDHFKKSLLKKLLGNKYFQS